MKWEETPSVLHTHDELSGSSAVTGRGNSPVLHANSPIARGRVEVENSSSSANWQKKRGREVVEPGTQDFGSLAPSCASPGPAKALKTRHCDERLQKKHYNVNLLWTHPNIRNTPRDHPHNNHNHKESPCTRKRVRPPSPSCDEDLTMPCISDPVEGKRRKTVEDVTCLLKKLHFESKAHKESILKEMEKAEMRHQQEWEAEQLQRNSDLGKVFLERRRIE
jgi:hypothetical protein